MTAILELTWYCATYEGGMVTLLRDHVLARGHVHGHAKA